MNRKISLFLLLLTTSLFSFEPVILLFGPPGAGKGTFSQQAKEKGYLHLSAGDLIRDEIAEKTPFGLKVEDIVKRGEYVDRDLFSQMVQDKITELSQLKKPLIIDGFARCESDMNDLVKLLSDLELTDRTFALFLESPDEVCKERILGRMVCPSCHHVYNKKSQAIYKGQECPVCHLGILEERMNDTPFVIEKRMKEYRKKIENNYRLSLNFFPALFFDSGQNEEVCYRFYDKLLLAIKNDQGNAKGFIDGFDAVKE